MSQKVYRRVSVIASTLVSPNASSSIFPPAPPQNISAAAVAAEVAASTLRLQVCALAFKFILDHLKWAQVLALQDLDLGVRGHLLLSQLDPQLQAW
jgi:hypothetical protein